MDQFRYSQQGVTQYIRDGTQPIQQCQQNLESHQQRQEILKDANVPEPNRRANVDSVL